MQRCVSAGSPGEAPRVSSTGGFPSPAPAPPPQAVRPLGREGGRVREDCCQDGRRHLGPVPGASLPLMGGSYAGESLGARGPKPGIGSVLETVLF